MSNNDAALPIAVKLIAGFEGFRSHVYQDGGGVWTQGYGCTYHPSGRRVMPTEAPITETQGMAWLERLVVAVLVRVRLMVDVELSDDAIAALTSLAYNCGTAAQQRPLHISHRAIRCLDLRRRGAGAGSGAAARGRGATIRRRCKRYESARAIGRRSAQSSANR
jgi:GH24 family phage-related lysozyme (muramidase)